MKIKRFTEAAGTSKASKLEGEVTLYRLTSHPVIDLSEPGEYYVSSKSDVDPNMLKKKGKDFYLITVKTNSSNVDVDASERECAKYNSKSVIAVKDDKKCELIKVEPY